MVGIPKEFLNPGVQASEAAKAAVKAIKDSVHTYVIPESKLVRQPDSDLFEKAAYMKSDEFWKDPENLAQFHRGVYLAEGGDFNKLAGELDEYGQKTIELEDGYGNLKVGLTDGPKKLVSISEYDHVYSPSHLSDSRSYTVLNGDDASIKRSEYHYENDAVGYKAQTKDMPKRITHEFDGYPYQTDIYSKDNQLKSKAYRYTHQEEIYDDNGKVCKIINYNEDQDPAHQLAYRPRKDAELKISSIFTLDENGKVTKRIFMNPDGKTISSVDYLDTDGTLLKVVHPTYEE